MPMNYAKTAMLLALLTAIFVGMGALVGGQSGMLIAFIVALGMNLFSFWKSDTMVLRMYGAEEVNAQSAPEYYGLVQELAQRAELHQVVKDLYYPPATMATLAAIVRQVAAAHGGEVTAAAYRDATVLGRKRAIQLLEHFDRIGLLRRVGDVHRLRADSRLFEEGDR